MSECRGQESYQEAIDQARHASSNATAAIESAYNALELARKKLAEVDAELEDLRAHFSERSNSEFYRLDPPNELETTALALPYRMPPGTKQVETLNDLF